MSVIIAYASEAERMVAADAAQAVIRASEGGRIIVLAEIMALLSAYYCAQMRARGSDDPQIAMIEFLAAVGERGVIYDNDGIIGRSH